MEKKESRFKDGEIAVLCVRVADSGGWRVDSYDEVICHHCKEKVLLAKSTVQTINESYGGLDAVSLVCAQCSGYPGLNLDKAEPIPLSKRQIDDINAFYLARAKKPWEAK